jgi:hypothetical protein
MKLIKENLQRNIDIYDDLLIKLREQNSIINIVEDIMLEVIDSWDATVIPGYKLHTSSDSIWLDLTTKEYMDYFGMTEEDFDDIDDDYKHFIKYVSNIRNGKYKGLMLKIHYQYPSVINEWEPIDINSERKEVLLEVEERLKSLNCKIEYNYNKGIIKEVENGLWDLKVLIPVNLSISNRINKSDGVSNKFIKDFDSFIKDYNIDGRGIDRLSNLIRSIK